MAEGINLRATLDDDASPELDGLNKKVKETGKEVDATAKKSKKLNTVWKRSFKSMRTAVRRLSGAVAKLGRNMSIMLAAGAAGLAGGFALLVRQGIKFNAELEQTTMQFAVIHQNAKKTKQVMKDIIEFSSSTPFQLGEVAKAGKILTAFGMDGIETLRNVGDAAAAAGRPMTEIAMAFGRISSGAFGEAFMRLAETGLATRKHLEMEGLEFNKGGSYVGTATQAIEAVKRIIETRFGGMMEKLAGTFSGAISTMKDNWNLFAGEFTKPLFNMLIPRIKEVTKLFQEWKESAAVRVIGEEFSVWVGKAIDWVFKYIGSLEDAYKTFQIGKRYFTGFFESIGAGFEWVTTVAGAFFGALKDDLIAFRTIVSGIMADPTSLFGGEDLDEKFGVVGGNWGEVLALASVEGFRHHWKKMMSDVEELKATTFSFHDDQAPEDNERYTALVTLLELEQEAEAASMAYRVGLLKSYKETWTGLYLEMAEITEDAFGGMADDMIRNNANIGDAIGNMWLTLRDNILVASARAALGWIADKARMLIAEKIFQSTSAGAKLLSDKIAAASTLKRAAVEKTATASSTSSFAGSATASYHAAHAFIPFVGSAIASGFVAGMMGQIAAVKAGTLGAGGFAAGGLIPGVGGGTADDQLASVSSGEYVVKKSAVDQLGVGLLDDINAGRGAGGGSLTLNISGGNSIEQSEIEELLVPLLERLYSRGRLALS
jgi:hypothetical protein